MYKYLEYKCVVTELFPYVYRRCVLRVDSVAQTVQIAAEVSFTLDDIKVTFNRQTQQNWTHRVCHLSSLHGFTQSFSLLHGLLYLGLVLGHERPSVTHTHWVQYALAIGTNIHTHWVQYAQYLSHRDNWHYKSLTSKVQLTKAFTAKKNLH